MFGLFGNRKENVIYPEDSSFESFVNACDAYNNQVEAVKKKSKRNKK